MGEAAGASLTWGQERGLWATTQASLDGPGHGQWVMWFVLKCSLLESLLQFALKQGSKTGPLSVIFQRLYIL